MFRGRELKLPRAHAQSGQTGQRRRARDSGATGDDQDAAALFLIAFRGERRERDGPQQLRPDLGTGGQRAATAASGADVTGAPASFSGAMKL